MVGLALLRPHTLHEIYEKIEKKIDGYQDYRKIWQTAQICMFSSYNFDEISKD